jgi:drug/metabolite transporter (DMT)-like permease
MINMIPYPGETFALLTAIIWAIAVILFKKSGESVHPIALNIFKNLLAFILFIPTILLSGGDLIYNISVNDYLLILASGVLGIGIADTLFFKSLNLLGAGLIAIVNCTYSPAIIIFSFLFLGEILTWWQIAGAIMIALAVLTAISRKKQGDITRRNLTFGIIYGVLGSLLTGIGVVIVKRVLEYSPLLWVTELRLLGGIIALLLILIFHSGRKKIIASLSAGQNWGYTISGSFTGAYMAMAIWLAGMKYAQASTASALNQTSNVFIFIFAWLLLKEPVNLRRGIGILIAISGALLVTFGV